MRVSGITACLTLAVAGCTPSPVFTAENVQAEGLTKAQARQILGVVLRHEGQPIDGRGVFVDDDLLDERGRPPHPGYFDFSLGYDSPEAGATQALGLYAVSVATGDVWELNKCQQYEFPELEQLQVSITRRTHRSTADEKDLRRSLGC